jgi:hypothetical protein
MFVHIRHDFTIALEEPQDFKKFKLVIDADRANKARLDRAFSGLATVSDDGHAWISEAWLRACDPANKAWQDSLTGMISAVKKFGWIDEKTGAIRAHIEGPGEAAKA